MSPAQVSCPACGGPIAFQIGSSLVAICPYCRSVVARGDRKLEDLGKVAALAETGSVLAVGLHGRYQGVPFDLTGRAQLGHPAGGVWDEWYAHFADGRWGWLAEAQGHFYLTFREPADHLNSLPAYEDLRAGQPIQLMRRAPELSVAEKARATARSAEGEIPYRLEPGQTYRYADLSGPDGAFATIDYGDEGAPLVFLGREVTLDDLGVPESARSRQEEHRVEGIHVNCPNCGGPLELKAPDQTERVGCPNCHALLDATKGELRLLQVLKPQGKPQLPIGSTAHFEDRDLLVIGFFVRSVTIDQVKYTWQEYLLYHPRLGFRWLVCSDHHWSYVRPLAAGEVRAHDRMAFYQHQGFTLFQKAKARIEYVLGECYWKVEVGEEVKAADYVRPPEMLSREATKEEEREEVNWSLGTYVPVGEIEQRCGKSGLPRPSTIAPDQPFPYKKVYLSWAVLLAAGILVGVILMAIAPVRKVYEQTIPLQPGETQTFFSEHFPLRGHGTITVTADADVTNTWLGIDGSLVRDDRDVVRQFAIGLEYYEGTDTDGEHYTEGSRRNDAYVSAPAAGEYTLNLEIHHEKDKGPRSLTIRVDQGGIRLSYWLLTLLVLSVVPILVGVYHLYFEQQRWAESNVK